MEPTANSQSGLADELESQNEVESQQVSEVNEITVEIISDLLEIID